MCTMRCIKTKHMRTPFFLNKKNNVHDSLCDIIFVHKEHFISHHGTIKTSTSCPDFCFVSIPMYTWWGTNSLNWEFSSAHVIMQIALLRYKPNVQIAIPITRSLSWLLRFILLERRIWRSELLNGIIYILSAKLFVTRDEGKTQLHISCFSPSSREFTHFSHAIYSASKISTTTPYII